MFSKLACDKHKTLLEKLLACGKHKTSLEKSLPLIK